MIHEVEAKTLLIKTKKPSAWFHVVYNMNIYRGCQHHCIYCDSRSDCYRIEHFDDDIQVKVNAIILLEKELQRRNSSYTVGTGAMCDPYMPIEKKYQLTGQALERIAFYHFPVTIITKSNLVLRDIDSLQKINEKIATVAFTITTTDDALAAIIEPGAPSPTERFEAMGILAELGIHVGVTMMPVLPFIEDSAKNIEDIVRKSAHYGASFIIPGFGVTMRDSQRAYFYDKLDQHFKGLKEKYIEKYHNNYYCHIQQYPKLNKLFKKLCVELGIVYQMQQLKRYSGISAQLSLFE